MSSFKAPTIPIYPTSNSHDSQTILRDYFRGEIFDESYLHIVCDDHDFIFGNEIHTDISTDCRGNRVTTFEVDSFTVWHSSHGTIYTRFIECPSYLNKSVNSIEECIKDLYCPIFEGNKFLSYAQCSNRKYRLICWCKQIGLANILFSFHRNNGAIQHITIKDIPIPNSGKEVTCSIHYSQPWFLVYDTFYTFNPMKEEISKGICMNMESPIILGDNIAIYYFRYDTCLICYIPIYRFFQFVEGKGNYYLNKLNISTRTKVDHIAISRIYPGISFLISSKEIHILNTKLQLICTLTIDSTLLFPSHKFTTVYEGNLIISNEYENTFATFHTKYLVRVPISRGDWSRERLIWLGLLSNNPECPFSIIPSDIIRIIIDYIQIWHYDPTMMKYN